MKREMGIKTVSPEELEAIATTRFKNPGLAKNGAFYVPSEFTTYVSDIYGPYERELRLAHEYQHHLDNLAGKLSGRDQAETRAQGYMSNLDLSKPYDKQGLLTGW